MAAKSVVLSWIASLLALLGIAAAVLLYFDTGQQVARVSEKVSNQKIAIDSLKNGKKEPTVTLEQFQDLETASEENRRMIFDYNMKLTQSAMGMEGLRKSITRNTNDLVSLGKLAARALEKADSIAESQPAEVTDPKLLDRLRGQAEVVAGLRVDINLLKKQLKDGPVSGDFNEAIKKLDPLQQKSDALEARMKKMREDLEKSKRDTKFMLLQEDVKLLRKEIAKLKETPGGEGGTDAKPAADPAALTALRKEVMSAIEAAKTEQQKDSKALRKESSTQMKRVALALKDLSSKMSTNKSLQTREMTKFATIIKAMQREMSSLREQGKGDQQEAAALAAVRAEVSELSNKIRTTQEAGQRKAIYFYHDAEGTFIVNPHKDWTAMLDRPEWDEESRDAAHTILRIPFSPAGKRISTSRLSADDSVGGFSGINCEAFSLPRARTLPLEQNLPEIYYYTDPGGTYIINPHENAVAVLNQSGTTHFTGVPHTRKSQRISEARLISGQAENGFNCLNFRVVYIGNFSKVRFE